MKTEQAQSGKTRMGKSPLRTVAWMIALLGTFAATTDALADGLPDGYTQLPYIKANANVQVKTGYTPKSFCDTPDYFVDWVRSRSNLYVAADVLQPRQTGSCASRLSSRVLSAAPLDRRKGNNV